MKNPYFKILLKSLKKIDPGWRTVSSFWDNNRPHAGLNSRENYTFQVDRLSSLRVELSVITSTTGYITLFTHQHTIRTWKPDVCDSFTDAKTITGLCDIFEITDSYIDERKIFEDIHNNNILFEEVIKGINSCGIPKDFFNYMRPQADVLEVFYRQVRVLYMRGGVWYVIKTDEDNLNLLPGKSFTRMKPGLIEEGDGIGGIIKKIPTIRKAISRRIAEQMRKT